MGEATYYLRARFPSSAEAQRVSDQLRSALVRLGEFTKRWEEIRGEHHRPCAERRQQLRDAFRDLEDMIPWDAIDEECRAVRRGDFAMHCCMGRLPEIGEDPFVEASVFAGEVLLSDRVWHFTSWDGIAAWLRAHGAIASGWVSDEAASLFDCIKLS
jgi:hypothetical protein